MNKELLKNPEVREIAEAYAQKMIDAKSLSNIKEKYWSEFVKENEPKKDWEILSFYYQAQTRITAHKTSNGRFFTGGDMGTEQEMLAAVWKINSVKRLSDKEVFTVGDNTLEGVIKSFEVKGDMMIVNMKEPSASDILFLHITIRVPITHPQLQHIKKPLFHTSDGKDIFEGDEFWVVLKEWTLLSFIAKEWTMYENVLMTFSTKINAEAYLLMNKPCLSVNDLINSGVIDDNSSQAVELKQLAKSKL